MKTGKYLTLFGKGNIDGLTMFCFSRDHSKVWLTSHKKSLKNEPFGICCCENFTGKMRLQSHGACKIVTGYETQWTL